MAAKLFPITFYLTTLFVSSQAFVSPQYTNSGIRPPKELPSSTLNLFDPTSMSEVMNSAATTVATATTTNSMWLATIDGDIASIPTNEFGTVFAGGIAVMVGGVLSAVIVGFILDKGDLYADVAAESYLQIADDEEFWKNLSAEERQQAQEVLDKIKESKGETSTTTTTAATTTNPAPAVTAVATEAVEEAQAPTDSSSSSSSIAPPKTDMFSDY